MQRGRPGQGTSDPGTKKTSLWPGHSVCVLATASVAWPQPQWPGHSLWDLATTVLWAGMAWPQPIRGLATASMAWPLPGMLAGSWIDVNVCDNIAQNFLEQSCDRIA